jgi:ketosteroid isomerase-like protein
MTSNSGRALILLRALRAAAEHDRQTIMDLCTADLRTWTSHTSTATLAALVAALDHRDVVFSDMHLDAHPLDVGGAAACAEWTLTMTHSGPIDIDGSTIAPTGARITMNGVTVAEFRGDRICSIRQYWDELDVLRQLQLPSPVTQ